MDLDRHDFQLTELMERIQANDNRLIALQVPEGLLTFTQGSGR